MKKIITTAGLVAIGAMGVTNVHAQAQDQSKPWSLSAALRGFYDDNYATAPSNPAAGAIGRRGSWGTDLNPQAAYNLSLDQTTINLSYIFDMRYYQDRKSNSADYSHQFGAKVEEQFSEIYSLSVGESFVIAQEPGVIDPTGVTTNPLRADGNNMRNTGTVSFKAQLTPTYQAELTYANSLYDYQQTGVAGGYAALLNRDENLVGLNLRAQIVPTFLGLVGYQFGLVKQEGKDSLVAFTPPAAALSPTVRDNRSHYFYVGGDYTATEQLSINGRVGVQYIEYPNAATLAPGSKTDSLNPYVDVSATYTYTKDSTVTLGVQNKHTQTDIVSGATPTLDQEATIGYLTVNHKITALLAVSLTAAVQNSIFNGGAANNQSEQYYTVGLTFDYEINKFLTAEATYMYDRLDSQIANRSFYRDRVFLGIKATY